MPLYEYTLLPSRRVVTLRRSVADMDKPVTTEDLRANGYRTRGRQQQYRAERQRMPSRVGFCLGVKPPSMGERLQKGFYQLESKGKLKDHPNYLPTATIKRALEMPDT